LYYDANVKFRILVKIPRNPGLRSRSWAFYSEPEFKIKIERSRISI